MGKAMKTLVCGWALFSACCIAGIVVHIFTDQGDGEHPVPVPAASAATSSSSSSCVDLTDVAASAVLAGQLWLSAPQATAAALAMLLPAGPRRRALAFVAHAANAFNHFLFATLVGLLPAAGNNHLIVRIMVLTFVCGVLDVLGFLALLEAE